MIATSNSKLEFETVDVFTNTLYSGNPLAVVKVPHGRQVSQKQKQTIAFEFNLSETIFLHDNPDDPLDRQVDIFIPVAEIPFAGHPTIGALCTIGKTAGIGAGRQSIKLRVKAGTINATYDPSTETAHASIPHNVHVHPPISGNELQSLQPGLSSFWNSTSSQRFPVVSVVKGMTFTLVDVLTLDRLSTCTSASATDLPSILDRIEEAWKPTFLGTYYFVIEDADACDADGVSCMKIRTRMMCTDVGEDPATGSAACTLAAWMSKRRRNGAQREEANWVDKLPKNASASRYRYKITQGVEMGRRSDIEVEVVMKDDQGEDIDKVILAGQAVQLMEGTLRLPQ